MKTLFMSLVVILTMVNISCRSQKKFFVKKNFFAMGTFVEITCYSNLSPSLVEEKIDKSFSEIKRIEKLLSRFDENSDIYKINHTSKNQVYDLSPETIEVIKKAKIFFAETEGAFDITVAALMDEWGFNRNSRIEVTAPEKIRPALTYSGADKIELDEENKKIILKQEGIKIDLGGIAKGYAVDKAKEILLQEGISNAIINIGGDLYCLGKSRNNQGWKIGIQHPRAKDKIITTITVSNKAVATSGDYENYINWGGEKYPHIIDPRTGMPVRNEIVSVTVIAGDCLTADALATSIFVLGREKGARLLESFDAEAIIITEENGELCIK